MRNRINYLKRIFSAYVLKKESQLSFWHGRPEINLDATYNDLGPYYQKFYYKAFYKGSFDDKGIPLLNYHGTIGKQYNPIAIAQYGLGHYNLCKKNRPESCKVFIDMSNFLVEHLEKNEYGLYVWYHHFDWDYRGRVKSPWYSGLAQGVGISLLTRAYNETHENRYLNAIHKAEESLFAPINKGGCTYLDTYKNPWIEEMIVYPPTHILNGFIWAVFGVYDLYLLTKDHFYLKTFSKYVHTIKSSLIRYDTGFWSFYDLSADKMLASPFYHRLHIVQLGILGKMTGNRYFLEIADKWYWYAQNELNKVIATVYKAGFKLLKY